MKSKETTRACNDLLSTSVFLIIASIFLFFYSLEASFAQKVYGIDATQGQEDLIEGILSGNPRQTGLLAASGVPLPGNEDGVALSQTHAYYTTNGDGKDDTIYEIDLASGNLTSQFQHQGANFQGLAYVDNFDGTGDDRVYGLDIIASQIIEFKPNPLTPTGNVLAVANADRGLAGGEGRLFVQVRLGARNEIWEIDPTNGARINVLSTPNNGAVLFEGLGFAHGNVYGAESLFPNSRIWKIEVRTGAIATPITLPYVFAALGARATEKASRVSPDGNVSTTWGRIKTEPR